MRRIAALGLATSVLGGWAAVGEADGLGDGLRPLEPTAPATLSATPPPVLTGGRLPLAGLSAVLVRPAPLRARPDGRVIERLKRRTPFGGRRALTVVARRGPWLGVLHEGLANGRAGWIHERHARLQRQRYAIVIDRSSRTATVRRDGRVVQRFDVGVGRQGSPTPVGRYGVTDRLLPSGRSPYGCCILALSGRQRSLPAGWVGGDRLALHGAPAGGIGQAASSGCVRVGERDMRLLLRRIPVGTRVDIRP